MRFFDGVSQKEPKETCREKKDDAVRNFFLQSNMGMFRNLGFFVFLSLSLDRICVACEYET